ncbi:carboxy terminal-processing peptidase [Flavilitoribacter nigricans]|uniref:Tail-specific protease n=1 Tax=Flavilitoribacter nigricans (strain ATCC 23147 / DSM 23189 / NBRC 102662 / NCIMB 1420 / SS-2) TaxID=1122177 RepID=A0A2D0N3Z3_FLAN2|nr:carboxy terminal-processing peptidase [Flavilitoribacter nigricans]PHN03096.1 tail-specific protease [Flavilitoribacter nigricans DSM 23189 = NBRC 102662]
MKKGPIFFSLVALVLLVAAYFPWVDNEQKEAVLVRTLIRGLEYMHFEPKEIDDNFSEQAFNLYLEDIDGARRLLTQEDIAKMEAYKFEIDDETANGDMTFFNLSLEIIDNALTKTQAYYQEILASPFDFDIKEKVQLNGEKRGWPATDAELQDYWRRFLKYEVMQEYAEKLEAQQKEQEKENGNEEILAKSKEELEADARQEVLTLFDRYYERLRKLKREDRLSTFLNTITSLFDPHTAYRKPFDSEQFDMRMSGKLEGIGATLQSEGDYTKVTRVVVGGPAWRGKDLEANDLITAVAQGDDEPVNIKGMVLDDVVQMIRGKKGTEVRLTIKKEGGEEQVISIIRDVVELEDVFAKSLIFDGVGEGERIGYIYLPSFYVDFNDRNGRSCAKDVAKELEKLKDEDVDGVILDLRDNGGGGLNEVVDMSGLFIEKGPIVQVKSRGRAPEVLKDTDSKVQYDGPLVVMTNFNSASASEILAAALQDYGRAVIVGSNSTFGKGTVQRVIDLDRTIRGFDQYKPLGDLHLTIQKYYRINGGSVQLRGVTPDIILPDVYHYIKTGEKDQKYPLAWTEIEPTDYSQDVIHLDYMTDLKENSMARVDANDKFQKVKDYARWFKDQRDDSEYSLLFTDYQAREKKQQETSESFRNLMKEGISSTVNNLAVDMSEIEKDESRVARNKSFIESKSKDIYIEETLNVMHDILEKESVRKAAQLKPDQGRN